MTHNYDLIPPHQIALQLRNSMRLWRRLRIFTAWYFLALWVVPSCIYLVASYSSAGAWDAVHFSYLLLHLSLFAYLLVLMGIQEYTQHQWQSYTSYDDLEDKCKVPSSGFGVHWINGIGHEDGPLGRNTIMEDLASTSYCYPRNMEVTKSAYDEARVLIWCARVARHAMLNFVVLGSIFLLAFAGHVYGVIVLRNAAAAFHALCAVILGFCIASSVFLLRDMVMEALENKNQKEQ